MNKVKLSLLTVFILVLFMTTTAAYAVPRLPSGPTYKDVVVAVADNEGEAFELRTNIYLPEEESAEPWPLVLFIHGNGGAYNFANGSRSYEFSIALADRGIAVATIDYRHEAGLPENVHDVKAYVRYFRAHADEYNIDPDRIAVWGTSRGGHLAAMLATTGDVKELEGDVGGNLNQSSCIQAAVIYYPYTDIFLYDDPSNILKIVFGLKEDEVDDVLEAKENHDTSSPYWKYVEAAELVNPMNYISDDDPPILIATGGHDEVTPLNHSTELFYKYLEHGLDASLYVWAPGVHGRVGTHIEAASSEWIVNKLLVDLAAKK